MLLIITNEKIISLVFRDSILMPDQQYEDRIEERENQQADGKVVAKAVKLISMKRHRKPIVEGGFCFYGDNCKANG
jgi:hypothetical protein